VTRHILLLALSAAMASLLASCTPPVTRPIGTVRFSLPEVNRQQTLLVFLPGIRDKSAVFAEEGFISAAQASGIQADMIGVDAHIGYYLEMQFLARLKEDVIDPAKLQGYRNIWLVGISLGGFGSLWYDLENPGDLAGIVALSPYLGEPEVVDEVARAGGLAFWRPAPYGELDDQHMIWRGLKNYEQQDKNRKRVYLGYGLRDKFAIADGLLAAVLPQGQVFTIEGGHDWATWQTLWNEILKSNAFRQSN
jgi:pimeloyl-ACP methyl ester carboxylesterase